MMGRGEEGAGLEGEQVNVDYGNWEKKAAESVTKKLESTREMPVQQLARTITLVLVAVLNLDSILLYLFTGIFIDSFATCSCIVEFSGRCQ